MKYKDSKYPLAERVQDLLGRMTLEEKHAQLLCLRGKNGPMLDENGNFDMQRAEPLLLRGFGRISEFGFVAKNARHMAELTNQIQRFCLEKTRLGIPVLCHEECLHGQMAPGATSFPAPIALASTWNPELLKKIYGLIAEETRSRGGTHALTPVVDVARDPRWGRVEETYGEDPHLVSQMGIAAVKGFQGESPTLDKKHIMATLKHFAAHGQPESGTNCSPVNVSQRVLREVFFPPFRDAIRKAGAMAVMPAYHEIDGVPVHANRWLLRDVLRKEWGFDGIVVSDYFAVYQLEERHKVVKNSAEAARLAFMSGVDVELPFEQCYQHLLESFRNGTISIALLDDAVARILTCKFRLGLFDDPYVDPAHAERICGSQTARPIALQAAREAVVLLKNEGGTLPLDRNKIKTIAVIGPNSNQRLLGGYSGTPNFYTTVYEGIKAKAGTGMEVLQSDGCWITEPGDWSDTNEVTPSDPVVDRERIRAAVETAKRADVIVLALGENELTCREAWNENHLGDRASLDLVGMQNDLVDALSLLGKPMVAFLFNGRPLGVGKLCSKVQALLECWYLGQEAGIAVGEILFGDVNPCGKLPISFPRSVGHLPAYYNHKPNDRRGYLFDDVSSLFPFGHGLSYTSFTYSEPVLEKNEIDRGGNTRISVMVRNAGNRDGDEVVQMYIRDKISSVTRPVRELKGFEKIHLKVGESRTVSFEIGPEQLAFHDIDMKYVVEPGEFEIMIGSSSRLEDLGRSVLCVEDKPKVAEF